MHAPWMKDGKFYATNGHVIVESLTAPEGIAINDESARLPNNIAAMFSAAFADPQWRELPELPAFDPCPVCGGTGIEEGETCHACGGYGEAIKRIAVGDTGFCIRYMRLLSSLPGVRLSPNGMSPCPFIFEGGRGVVMPMRNWPN